MESAAVGRSAIISARAFLFVLAWVFIAPGSAEARCSDYVQSKSAAPGHKSNLAELGHTGLHNVATEPASPQLPKRRTPCSGALCSGQPASPLVPAHADVHHSGQWAIISSTVQTTNPGPGYNRLSEEAALGTHRRTSVYHPPRSSRSLRAC